MAADSAAGNVVLVHGGFVDGSGWHGVYSRLKKDGYNVSIVQNPTLSLEGDVAATKRVIDGQSEPVTLVAIPMVERSSPRLVITPTWLGSSISRPSPRTRANRWRR
jgi:hypothetical protein